jgi:hypothetical protein
MPRLLERNDWIRYQERCQPPAPQNPRHLVVPRCLGCAACAAAGNPCPRPGASSIAVPGTRAPRGCQLPGMPSIECFAHSPASSGKQAAALRSYLTVRSKDGVVWSYSSRLAARVTRGRAGRLILSTAVQQRILRMMGTSAFISRVLVMRKPVMRPLSEAWHASFGDVRCYSVRS